MTGIDTAAIKSYFVHIFVKKIVLGLSIVFFNYFGNQEDMMVENCIFNCEVCGTTKEVATSPDCAPECCEQPMKQKSDLPVCETTVTAEHSRMEDLGEPCDDGR